MIARGVFGGAPDIQVSTGVVAMMTTVGLFIAYYNIKRLQIDQHRAWMLRTFFYVRDISWFPQTDGEMLTNMI